MTPHQTPPSVTDEMVEAAARAIDPTAWAWIDRTERENPDHLALAPTKENRLNAAKAGLTAALAAMPGGVAHGCKCQGCGNLYRVDITVPDELWNRIRPEGKPEGAGLLCGHCIVSRVEAIGEFSALTAALAAMSGGVDESNTDPDSPTGYVKGSEFPRLNASAIGAEGWRPIETAPKDGTRLLLWSPSEGQFTGAYDVGNGWSAVIGPDTYLDGMGATHWQPLPAPPTAQEGK